MATGYKFGIFVFIMMDLEIKTKWVSCPPIIYFSEISSN